MKLEAHREVRPRPRHCSSSLRWVDGWADEWDSFALATDATARVRQKALPQLYKELE